MERVQGDPNFRFVISTESSDEDSDSEDDSSDGTEDWRRSNWNERVSSSRWLRGWAFRCIGPNNTDASADCEDLPPKKKKDGTMSKKDKKDTRH